MTETPNGGWIPTADDFGARLALIRQRMGWGNVTAAATACGLPVSSWRYWERDNVLPREYMATCQTIAIATGCDFAWLVGMPPIDAPTTGGIALPHLAGRHRKSDDELELDEQEDHDGGPPDDSPEAGWSPRASRPASAATSAGR